jgi:glycosyltransferase involved in cell wall biosynthesis
MHFTFWFSGAICLLSLIFLIEIVLGVRQLKFLRDVPANLAAAPPKVSIIVCALNEADTIEPALRSLLTLDYPNLEIIAINDRSTDGTPDILDRMARSHPQLRVLHVATLPADWLGKTHAMHQGALIASGDYLLFTDADVIFAPSTLSRAITYCEQHQLDHLTLLFEAIVNEELLRMLLLSVMSSLLRHFKPWKLRTSNQHYFGVGAFNLVRQSAYHAAGGHSALPMSVLDDMMLGKLMNQKGCRQEVMLGIDLVAVEWYRNSIDMLRGLQKNTFAVFDFRLSKLIAATVFMLAFNVWPWIGLYITTGATRWLNLTTLLLELSFFLGMIHGNGWRLRCLIFWPVITPLTLAMWWQGSLLTLMRGGIVWRGTFYSLRQLKRHLF